MRIFVAEYDKNRVKKSFYSMIQQIIFLWNEALN